jgi:hypothetical protein
MLGKRSKRRKGKTPQRAGCMAQGLEEQALLEGE